MQRSIKILLGPPTQPDTQFTCRISANGTHVFFRKKVGNARVACVTNASLAWVKTPGDDERILVFRSRISGIWLTREQFDQEKKEMRAFRAKHLGDYFTTENGYMQVEKSPTHGAIGWKQCGNRRIQHIFTDGRWIPFRRNALESWV